MMDAPLLGLWMTLAASASPAPELSVLEDPQGELRIEQVVQASREGRFEPAPTRPLNLGLSASAWWLRIEITAQPSARLLALPYTQIDHLTLYTPGDDGDWVSSEAGDHLPMSRRALPHPHPLFEIPPGLAGPLFLRAASSGSITLPILIEDERAFRERDRLAQLGYGAYYAVLLAFALYNAFLWAMIRDRAYLSYVLYLLGLLLFQGSYSGHGAWLLWPDLAWLGHAGALLGLCATLGFGSAFVAGLCQSARRVPRWHRALQGLMGASMVAAPLVMLDYRVALAILLAAVLASLLVFPATIIGAYRAGERQARFLIVGLAAFLPGVLLLVLRTIGVVPGNWWTEHAYQIGTLAEVLLLSFALADRINLLNAERDRANQALAEQRERGARALLDTQDAERRRIAQDLHDGLGQQLLGLLGGLRPLSAQDKAPLEQGLREAIQETRRVAANLYPTQLDRLGLRDALEAMMATLFEPAGIACTHDIDELSLHPRDALQVFRIAQEALSNVLRHAGARRVSLHLQRLDAGYRLRIDDDGRGLPPAEQRRAGRGLTGLQDRALQLDGRLHITARPGGGTRIELEAPLRHG